MADHIRKQVRGAIATLLDGLATTGDQVYRSRVYALTPNLETPVLLVYTPTEDASDTAGQGFCAPATLSRTITVSIEAVAMANVDLDDLLDQICKEVEVKMATDPTLAGKVQSVKYTKTDFTLQGGDAEKPIGSARMTWIAKVNTTEGVPDVAV